MDASFFCLPNFCKMFSGTKLNDQKVHFLPPFLLIFTTGANNSRVDCIYIIYTI